LIAQAVRDFERASMTSAHAGAKRRIRFGPGLSCGFGSHQRTDPHGYTANEIATCDRPIHSNKLT
jgi:hypothetical protein